MKILYAASNNQNAKIQLARLLSNIRDSSHQFKIAAYKQSSPIDINIDWTLDCLLNIYRPELLSLNNDNLAIYFEQVKNFAPDLIITDLEYFTSYIANDLNIPLWQCSSSLINFALTKQEKYGLGLFKYYAHLLNRDPINTQRIANIIENSDRNFVYSHYGDTEAPPSIEAKFEWIRPYHQVAKDYVPCQHYATAGLSASNKQILDVLKKYPDSVAFIEHYQETYNNVLIKDIELQEEYYCNMKNSNLFICQGQMGFLADAFYNGKYSLIYPDYEDTESVISSQLSQKLKLGRIMSYSEDISDFVSSQVHPACLGSIKYLHERIEELL